MRDSGYPAALDTAASIANVDEATDLLCANVPNEHAAMVEAIERALGVAPSDLSSINYGAFGSVAALLLGRLRYEIREYTHPGSGVTQHAVTFATARFTQAPKVFLFPRRASMGNGDDTFAVYNVTATGFTSVRNTANGTPSTVDYPMAYLAIQWTPPTLDTSSLLLEDGSYLLLESGDHLLLE